MSIEGVKGKRVLLLVPPVTYRATDFVQAANRLALDVVIGSNGALPLGGTPVVHVDPAISASVSPSSTISRVDAVVAVDMTCCRWRPDAALGLAGNLPAAITAEQVPSGSGRGGILAGFQVIDGDPTLRAWAPCVAKPVCSAPAAALRALTTKRASRLPWRKLRHPGRAAEETQSRS